MNKLLNFEFRRPGPPGRMCYKLIIFLMTRQKPLKTNLRLEYYYCQNIAGGNGS